MCSPSLGIRGGGAADPEHGACAVHGVVAGRAAIGAGRARDRLAVAAGGEPPLAGGAEAGGGTLPGLLPRQSKGRQRQVRIICCQC